MKATKTHPPRNGNPLKQSYPGEGIAWADFLHHRRRVIEELTQEGKSHEAIAILLSMDAEQVRAILRSGAIAADGIFSREGLARAAMRRPVDLNSTYERLRNEITKSKPYLKIRFTA